MTDHLDQASIDAARVRADRSESALRDLVGKLCPGPHLPTQHRDRKPPWCRACGRTARGVAVKAQCVPCGKVSNWPKIEREGDRDE